MLDFSPTFSSGTAFHNWGLINTCNSEWAWKHVKFKDCNLFVSTRCLSRGPLLRTPKREANSNKDVTNVVQLLVSPVTTCIITVTKISHANNAPSKRLTACNKLTTFPFKLDTFHRWDARISKTNVANTILQFFHSFLHLKQYRLRVLSRWPAFAGTWPKRYAPTSLEHMFRFKMFTSKTYLQCVPPQL